MREIIVIGIGNRQRGDDQVGFLVCDHLKSQLPKIRCINFEGQPIDLMNLWTPADYVILIDCTQTGSEPGTQIQFDVTQKPLPNVFSPSSSHTLTVSDGIELARKLGRMPKSLIVYGLEGQNFEIGSSMSEPVRRSIPDLVTTITTHIERKLKHA